MNINWYPGHMTKAKRMITENLKLVIWLRKSWTQEYPIPAENPDFKELFSNKLQIVVLNKADLADPVTTEKWRKYYDKIDTPVIFS